MPSQLGWGILGTGNIARQFAAGVNACHRGQLVAVGSRQRATADAFARTHKIPAAYGGYEDVLRDPRVNAIYVSLPNTLHHPWTLAALAAGKHVLCEKPLACSAAQAQEMFDAADRAGRLVMEAFMYRSHPLTHAVGRLVAAGAIGQVRLVRTSFCYRTTKVAGNIRFASELAGGTLMDVGCYCISYSRLITGEEPIAVHAQAHIHEAGVDDIVVGTLRFGSGALASFTCGMSVQADNTAYICGSDGYIEVPVPWKPPATAARYTVAHSAPPRMDNPSVPAPPPRQTHEVDAGMDLYGLEADDFAASALDGSPLRVGRQDTLGNLRVLDELRRQIGAA
jgi:predicted dehydrogenase